MVSQEQWQEWPGMNLTPSPLASTTAQIGPPANTDRSLGELDQRSGRNEWWAKWEFENDRTSPLIQRKGQCSIPPEPLASSAQRPKRPSYRDSLNYLLQDAF